MSSFYDFQLEAIDGKLIPFDAFKGKKVLLINVASACGYTPQYEHLQAFHKAYGNQFVVLGFPANNFGGQEPGTNQEIAQFCSLNYGIEFQLFSKISVVGPDQHPLYQYLSSELNQDPTWNFCKYLVDEHGEVLEFFPASVSPFDDGIMKYVQETMS